MVSPELPRIIAINYGVPEITAYQIKSTNAYNYLDSLYHYVATGKLCFSHFDWSARTFSTHFLS